LEFSTILPKKKRYQKIETNFEFFTIFRKIPKIEFKIQISALARKTSGKNGLSGQACEASSPKALATSPAVCSCLGSWTKYQSKMGVAGLMPHLRSLPVAGV
jgi:hypothetical protein